MLLEGMERHRNEGRISPTVPVATHHQIGVVPGGAGTRAVDEQQIEGACLAFEPRLLQEAGAVAEQFECGCEGCEAAAQALRIGGAAIFPILGILGGSAR